MTRKETYQQKLQAQLDVWKAEISKLEARASQLEGEARIALLEQIEDLHANRKAITKKMEKLRDASDDAWQDIQTGIDGAWRNLDNAVRAAVSRFN
jgi:chromosome segregation ATPase